MKPWIIIAACIIVGGAFAFISHRPTPENSVNVYSYRQPFLLKPLTDAFTAKTGIAVNTVYSKKGLAEKLKAEGARSPADVILSSDVGALHDLTVADVVAPIESAILEDTIPSHLRHPEDKWFGLTVRGRALFVSKERVPPGAITGYADLAAPQWRGRVCMRSAKHVYNISLIAAMIARQGEQVAENWLRGVKANLARKPQGNDRAQAKAIKEGVCDVALANTYYLGKMLTNQSEPEQQSWADAIEMIFPDQDGPGTYINISGVALAKNAKHVDNAIRFIEFMASDEAQKIYAEQNFEYPVKEGIALHPIVENWGDFKSEETPLSTVAIHRPQASRLVDRVGFDH